VLFRDEATKALTLLRLQAENRSQREKRVWQME